MADLRPAVASRLRDARHVRREMSNARSPVAFGRYIITRRIARGGMAEIYRARTRATDGPTRWVAVKMMRSALGHEDLREQLFEREVRIASLLDHPHVVPIYQYGREMERSYLAMEYIRGRDLSHLLKARAQAPLPLGVVLYVGYCAAAGLGHAHRMTEPGTGRPLGIVHRDVSPGNVMVGYDGTVKVLDFGVARMNESHGLRTQTGTLRGKFAYMSPEQTLGEELDARSDVFSLGTVLYELLTGTNCFRAQNPIATLEKVQGMRPVPPSKVSRQIPRAVDRVLARCLAKDRKRRFPDGQALSEALGELLEERGMNGPQALAAHMAATFATERVAEDRELREEEDEVALFDVIDFAALRDDVSLDAADVAISLEEEASQSDVRSVARAVFRGRDESEVFEAADPLGEVGDTTRLPADLAEQAEGAHGRRGLERADGAARGASGGPGSARTEVGGPAPRIFGQAAPAAAGFEETGAVLPGRAVEVVASLLQGEEGGAPALTQAVPSPLLGPAGMGPTGRGDDETRVASVETLARLTAPQRSPWRRTVAWIGGTLGLVAAVAILVTQASSAERAQQASATALDPVTITVEDLGDKAEPAPRAHQRVRLPGPEGERREEATPVSARAPARPTRERVEAPRERPARRVEAPVDEREPGSVPRLSVPAPDRSARSAAPTTAAVKTKKAQTGFLNVGAKPWAEIKIDGKPWPYQTPQAGIELPVGKHNVTLTNPETKVTKSTVVYIKSGAYRTVMMDMRTQD